MDYLEILQCPASGQALIASESGGLITADGSHEYPVVDDIPVLLDSSGSLFAGVMDRARTKGTTGSGSKIGWIWNLMPSPTLSVGQAERFGQMIDLILGADATRNEKPKLLVIGGGAPGSGMEHLLSSDRIERIETDVYFGPQVGLVCDAHQLPFRDGSIDAVVIQAVLEHVLSPETVVAEIHRVLKPDGIVYAETPFMQQVHEGAYDFTRFTELGQRRLFRGFSELGRGVVCGPATALVWSFRYFARSLPRRSSRAIGVLGILAVLLTFWIKYLDLFLVDHRAASDGAAGTWFMGRKLDSPVPDDEIVATYRGAINPVKGR